MTKVLVLYYSSYGHVETMAHAVAAGAREAGADIVVKRVPDLVSEGVARKSGYKLDQAAPVATVDELANYDAIAGLLSGVSQTVAGSSPARISACPASHDRVSHLGRICTLEEQGAAMSLTFGHGPFGQQPGGEFNFTRQGPKAVLYCEGFPKRVRVEFNGLTIADSRRVKTLHETGKFMVFYFRREDVDMTRLERTDHRSECPHKGVASYWTVRVGDRTAENAAWSYENPIASARFIAGYLAFYFEKMDAWYQEDERVYAHPRDPYHRFDVHRSSRHVVVRHGGVVIAESSKPKVLFETGTPPRYYLQPEDVRTDS